MIPTSESVPPQNQQRTKRRNLPEYRVWMAMRTRCNQPSHDKYENYGGRGISICPEWDDFWQFYEDMGPKPTPKHSIDRKDVDGNYCPENCRWATRAEQAANKRNNRIVTYQGEEMHLAEAIRRSGANASAVDYRIAAGWPEERWFEPRKEGDGAVGKVTDMQALEIYRSKLSTKELSEMFGLSVAAIQSIRRKQTWQHIHPTRR